MKKIHVLILTSMAIIGFTGCNKLLEKEPLVSVVDEKFYQTDQDLIAAVNASYANLTYEGDGSIYAPQWAYGDIVSDDARKGGGSLGDIPYWNQNETFTSNSGDPGLRQVWFQNYLGVNRANIVLAKAPTAPQASAAIKNRVTAEAKFLRAYYHFQLMKMFGMNEGIPLITKVLQAGEFEQPRSSKEAVFVQIENDLKDAAASLPSKGATEIGRATKDAALGLLTRVYLFHGQMADVLTTAETIINSGKFQLTDIKSKPDVDSAFAAIFSAANENNSESLFEIQFATQGTGDWFGTTGTISNVMMRGRNNSGWGFNIPTQSLYNEFESGDPRREGTIFKDGDVIFSGERFVASPANEYPYAPFMGRKHIERASTLTPNASDNPTNWVVVRYADILLMAAEAANQTGNDTKAQGYLNQVRSRAGLGNVTSTGALLKTAIWKERRVELALEGLRFFDLVRQGRAAEVMLATGDAGFSEGRLFRKGVNEVFPIPQTEIGLSQGKLQQNAGYN